MIVFRHHIRIALLFSLAVLGAGCEEMPPANSFKPAAVAPTRAPGFWKGEDASGPPRIVVRLSEQKAYFYKGKQLVGASTVSTGKPGFSTPPGHYHIISKDRNHVSSEFGDYVDDEGNVVKANVDARKDQRPSGSHFDGAKMPFCMHFNGGYAMHQGYVPPYAASHGCIRLPNGMAEHFFDAAPTGTPMIVHE
ncbi:MAG: L,D-transpeptidase [Verrucomicrobiota bacterium]